MNRKGRGITIGIISVIIVGLLTISMHALFGAKKNTASVEQPSVTIAHADWIGFYPLDLAQKKGFFKGYGANVKIKTIESKSDSQSALAAGKIQGIATSLDTTILSAANGLKIQNVLALDTSKGADGLVGNKNIKSFKDLKGKTLALDTTGGASYFWFNYMLRKNHMNLKEMKVQSMNSGDAGSAYVSGKVDAAMTWQPWLTKAEDKPNGHVIKSSKNSPGVIVDSLEMSTSYIKKHPKVITAIIKGWYKALNYIKAHPTSAYKMMSKGSGVSPNVLKQEMTEQIQLYDKSANKSYFGTNENHGSIYKIANVASDIWYANKISKNKADTDAAINPDFVNQIK